MSKLNERYELHELVGEGGMAQVYHATQLGLSREVAIKLISLDAGDTNAAQQFQKEARAIARLSHPHILQVYDYDQTEDGRYFMVMEYIPYGDLQKHFFQFLAQHRKPSILDALVIVKAVAQGLHHAHEAGIVHRDVKLSNIFLTKDGRVVMGDFGVAKLTGDMYKSVSGALVGTPLTLSPEQARGEPVDQRSDIYSLGVVFFQLVTGQPPFKATSFMQMIQHHLNTIPPAAHELNPDLPPEISPIILRMMSKDAANRHQTMLEVVAEIDSLMENHPDLENTLMLSNTQQTFANTTLPRFITSRPGSPSRPFSKRLVFFFALLILLVAGAAAYGLFGMGSDAETNAFMIAPVSPASAEEHLILLAPMIDEASQVDMGALLLEALQTGILSRLFQDELRIEQITQSVQNETDASRLAQVTNADVVVWGRRDASGWQLSVEAPNYPEGVMKRLRASVLLGENYERVLSGEVPPILEFYVRMLTMHPLIEKDQMLPLFVLALSGEPLSNEAAQLATTSFDAQVIDFLNLFGSNQYAEGDRMATEILKITPNDLTIHFLRWGTNTLAGRETLADSDVARLMELTNKSELSLGLVHITDFLFGNVEDLAASFDEMRFSTTQQMPTIMLYQGAIDQGRYGDTLNSILSYQAWLGERGVEKPETVSLAALLFLHTLQGDEARVQELIPVYQVFRESYFFQEGNRFLRRVQPDRYPPIALLLDTFANEISGESITARLSYAFGLGLHPDYYLLNWRQAHFDISDGLYQSAYNRFDKVVENAPVPFPIARYEQALLVQDHAADLENPRSACDLLVEARKMAEEADPEFYALLLEKLALVDCE